MSGPTVAVAVQARMGSTRLPGKVLREFVGDETVLGYLLGRLSTCCRLDQVVVATTNNSQDDCLVEWLQERKHTCFRGSEPDCLDRYAKLANAFKIDIVVRVTADCPLVVPQVVDEIVAYYLENQSEVDYLSNRQYTNFPEGLDVEVFTRAMLEEAADRATAPREREHINYYFLTRSEEYRIRYYNHTLGKDYSRFKLSIDTQSDLDRMRALFRMHRLSPDFTFEELIAVLSGLAAGRSTPS